MVVASGFIEPLLNLVVFGYGVGNFIRNIELDNGQTVSYASFVVPGLLASAAMMGAIMDATWNVFFKIHESRLYHAMLATSLGPMDEGEVGIGAFSAPLVWLTSKWMHTWRQYTLDCETVRRCLAKLDPVFLDSFGSGIDALLCR